MDFIKSAKQVLTAAGITPGQSFDSLNDVQRFAVQTNAGRIHQIKYGNPCHSETFHAYPVDTHER